MEAAMLFNYIKVAWRNLIKFKAHSLINIIGLAIGIAFCILTYLFVQHEHSYDNFHENGDRIYLTLVQRGTFGGRRPSGSTPPILAQTIKDTLPEIESIARVYGWNIKDGTPVRRNEEVFLMRGFYVDPEFMRMFSFPRVAGQPETALEDRQSVVITPMMAEKYFGNENPLGQTLSIRLRGGEELLVVKGVIDVPPNSSFQFDFLIPHVLRGEKLGGWGSNNVYTFVQLLPGVQAGDMEDKFRAFFANYFSQSRENQDYFGSPERSLRLLPLKKLYLNTIIRKWLTMQSARLYSYVLSGIALAVLLIACVNFINLSLGLSSHRFKEVGMRKVVGASRTQLIKQFLSESILLSFLALLAGIILAVLILPIFSRLIDRGLYFNFQALWAPLLGLAVLVGILAGFYPALVLSGFHPIEILKGRFQISGKKRLSSSLVVLQFALSAILIIATFIMARQMQHMREVNLGFNADQVVVIDAGGFSTGLSETEMKRVLGVYRQTASQRQNVLSATMSSMSFGREDLWGTGFEYDGREIPCRMYSIDYDYVETLGMSLVKGREFSRTHPSDPNESVMVNESLVKIFGWDDPIGKTLPTDNDMLPGKIVGVLQDSNLRSLHYEVLPAVFHLRSINGSFRYIFIRIAANDLPAAKELLESIWKQTVPDRPFIYSFLDEDVDRVFKEDERWAEIAQYSAFFAILIACLGAFGLISLTVARRTKEVGIRRVLGASEISIVILLSRDFFKLILLANGIAWPLAFVLLRGWLQDFAYRIDLGLSFFILGSILTFLIVFASISIRVIKASRADPADSLRYE
jgi:putative ABC transport system permease protein